MWEKFETWNFISKHNETSWECHLCVQHFINLTLSSDSQLLVLRYMVQFSSVQFSLSVVSDSLQTHGLQHTSLPVHHQLPELTQTHVHRVGDAIHQAGDDDVTWCTVLYNTVSRNGRNSNKYTQGFLSHSLKALSTHENYFSKYDL